MVPPFTKSVAVIAPQDVDGAVQLARQTGADILQIHASLSAEEMAELKGRVRQKLVAGLAAGCSLSRPRATHRVPMPCCWTLWPMASWAEQEPSMTGIKALSWPGA